LKIFAVLLSALFTNHAAVITVSDVRKFTEESGTLVTRSDLEYGYVKMRW